MRKILIGLKYTVSILTLLTALYFLILIHPGPFFRYTVRYSQFRVFSDKPIEPEIDKILNDALARIRKSGIYDSTVIFKIYICNKNWRLMLFTQGEKNTGGITYTGLTNNIFLREADIRNNKIIPAPGWRFAKNPATFQDRPLSYYIAHESVHVLQSKYAGRQFSKLPVWIIEGYADYIGKNGNFDFRQNLEMLRMNAPEMNPALGLYRRYHLYIAYLLDIRHMTIQSLFNTPPDETSVLAQLSKL